MYLIKDREVEDIKDFKLTWKTVYDVMTSRCGHLGGFGEKRVATFDNREDAQRYFEECEYLEEQKRAEYEKNKKEREPQNGSSREWDRHVAECYNDWNVAHGYRY